MFRRLFLILTLAFLFGLGQQGAAVHAISHFAEEQGQTQNNQTQDNKATHTAFCDKCVTYTALGSAVDVGHSAFILPSAPESHIAAASVRLRTEASYHYAARAPPLLV